jgi:hypothetical protein
MFTAALLTVVERWKTPRCPLTDDQRSKMCAQYSGILFILKKEKKHVT